MKSVAPDKVVDDLVAFRLIAVILIGIALSHSADAQHLSPEESVIGESKRFDKAFDSADFDTISSIFGSDIVMTSAGGSRETKC